MGPKTEQCRRNFLEKLSAIVPIMQKTVLGFGHIETAIEVALMPAEAYMKEESATGRVASLLMFRGYKRYPHEVFLPSAYINQLKFIYSELDDERDLSQSVAGLPSGKKTESHLTVFSFAQVARIFFHEIGKDFEPHLSEREREVARHGVQVIQVWLNLGCPWVGAAVDKCRETGYFLGGAAPRWFNQDGLLMQKVFCAPFFDQIQLYSDRAKQLLQIIKDDWHKSNWPSSGR